MKTLYVFYDADCGICSGVRRWLRGERTFVNVELLPYNSRKAGMLCPDLLDRGADQELIVMADDGRIWQGAEAWVTCLWALKRWRKWSRRLAKPSLLPLARKMCHLISANRLTISRLSGLESDAVLAQEIADTEAGLRNKTGWAINCVIKDREEGRLK